MTRSPAGLSTLAVGGIVGLLTKRMVGGLEVWLEDKTQSVSKGKHQQSNIFLASY